MARVYASASMARLSSVSVVLCAVSRIDTAQRTCYHGSQLPGGSGVALLLLRNPAAFFGVSPVEQLAEGRH